MKSKRMSLPQVAADVTLPHRQIVLRSRGRNCVFRHIHPMGDKAALPGEVQEGAAATADIEQRPPAAAPARAALQEAHVIQSHELPIGAFHLAESRRKIRSRIGRPPVPPGIKGCQGNRIRERVLEYAAAGPAAAQLKAARGNAEQPVGRDGIETGIGRCTDRARGPGVGAVLRALFGS